MAFDRPLILTMCGRKGYLARTLRAAGATQLIGIDADPMAPSAAVFDEFVVAPRIGGDPAGYVEFLLETAERWSGAVFVSLNDLDAGLLAHARPRLASMSARVLGCDAATTEVLQDKRAAAEWFAQQGFRTPPTRTLKETTEQGPPGEGPWIVKARQGQGSAGFRAYEVGEEACDAELIVQPRVTGRQVDADILRDADGQLIVALKEKETSVAGTAVVTRSLIDPRLEGLCRELGDRLAHVGLVDADIIVPVDDEPILLEVNARVGGCFAHACMTCHGIAAQFLRVCEGLPMQVAGIQTDPDVRVYMDPHPVILSEPDKQ